jgi:carbohydrate binding protein with CBM4/9 domain
MRRTFAWSLTSTTLLGILLAAREARVLRTVSLVMLICSLVSARTASAFPQKLSSSGRLDFDYGSLVDAAEEPGTTYKPESKLFFTGDGRWWAVLGTSGDGVNAAGVYLYELDADHDWQLRHQLPGSDPWAKADTLLVGQTLYVVLRDNRSLKNNPRANELYELTYLGSGAWKDLSGPIPITTTDVETLTVAHDSTGRLWTAFENGGKIKVGYTAPGGTTFTFANLPTSNVDADDIAAVTAFGSAATGYKIGVIWSDQVAKRDWFAWRYDTDAINSATWYIETAYGAGVGNCPTSTSGKCADDHINVKVNGDDLYVAIKTSLNDPSKSNPSDPLIALLKRNAMGQWSAFRVSTVAENATRPIVLAAPQLDRLWVFAQKDSSIVAWESRLSAVQFTSSTSTTFIKSSSGTMNDATSTKQLITAASGAVVEASIASREEYWHNEFLTSAAATPTRTPSAGPTATRTPTPPAGQNLVSNPGFEVDTSGWETADAGITLTRISGGHTGGFSARLANTNAAPSFCRLNDHPNVVGTTSAGTYTANLWVRAPTAGATLKIRFRESQSSTVIGSKSASVVLSTAWQRVTVSYVPVAPPTNLDFNAYVDNAAVGVCFYADDASITLN